MVQQFQNGTERTNGKTTEEVVQEEEVQHMDAIQ